MLAVTLDLCLLCTHTQSTLPSLFVSSKLALELHAPALSGLTSIRLPRTLLLVSAHTGAELDVDSRGRREAEALGYLDEIQLVHVEDAAETV